MQQKKYPTKDKTYVIAYRVIDNLDNINIEKYNDVEGKDEFYAKWHFIDRLLSEIPDATHILSDDNIVKIFEGDELKFQIKILDVVEKK